MAIKEGLRELIRSRVNVMRKSKVWVVTKPYEAINCKRNKIDILKKIFSKYSNTSYLKLILPGKIMIVYVTHVTQ